VRLQGAIVVRQVGETVLLPGAQSPQRWGQTPARAGRQSHTPRHARTSRRGAGSPGTLARGHLRPQPFPTAPRPGTWTCPAPRGQ
jgi:hypothetical protein